MEKIFAIFSYSSHAQEANKFFEKIILASLPSYDMIQTLEIKAVSLPDIHRRSNVVCAATTDQRYQQSADKRLHLKRKILVGAASTHCEAQRGIHKQRFMQRVIPDPGYC